MQHASSCLICCLPADGLTCYLPADGLKCSMPAAASFAACQPMASHAICQLMASSAARQPLPLHIGRKESVAEVVSSGLDVFAHNIETVERLQVSSPGAQARAWLLPPSELVQQRVHVCSYGDIFALPVCKFAVERCCCSFYCVRMCSLVRVKSRTHPLLVVGAAAVVSQVVNQPVQEETSGGKQQACFGAWLNACVGGAEVLCVKQKTCSQVKMANLARQGGPFKQHRKQQVVSFFASLSVVDDPSISFGC
eukprot:1160521-Pelagomonas_calceolata.AAC.2